MKGFLKLWITPKITDVFRCFSNHFKGKFAKSVKNVAKNGTNSSLDIEEVWTYSKKGVKIQTCKSTYKIIVKIIIFEFSRKFK